MSHFFEYIYIYTVVLYIFNLPTYSDTNQRLKPAAARAEEIFGPLDVDGDGEITMEEFVDGYMKIHTTSNGKRRWSRKVSLAQNFGEKDLAKVGMKMGVITGGGIDKEVPENESKEKKDNKNPIFSQLTTVLKDKGKENKDGVQGNTKADAKGADNIRRKSEDKKSKS